MIQRASVRGCAAFVVLVVAVLQAAPARAVTVPVVFTGTQQNFDVTVDDVTGNVFANGSGTVVNTKNKVEPFKFTAPLNHALQLFGVGSASSDPKSDALGTQFDLGVFSRLLSISDLDVDFLNGQAAEFALDTVFLTTNSTASLLKSISIDVSGALTGLRFDQTGMAIVDGDLPSGTFTVYGNMTANVDNLLAVVFGLLQVPVGGQEVTWPTELAGTWTTSTANFSTAKISLDGSIGLNIPISLLTNLTTSTTDVLSLTISSTVDLAATLLVSANYHLEAIVPYVPLPEPGSVVLLGIGLAAVGGMAVQRRRGRHLR